MAEQGFVEATGSICEIVKARYRVTVTRNRRTREAGETYFRFLMSSFATNQQLILTTSMKLELVILGLAKG